MYMSPAIKFIQKLKLDIPVVDEYRKLRGLLKQYNFTESQTGKAFNIPLDLILAREKVMSEFIKLKKSLKGYGFIDDINENPREITMYLENKLKEVDSEISLEGNTGYYGDRSEV